MFPTSIYFMKTIEWNPHMIESSSCNLKILSVMDLSLISLYISWGIHPMSKESRHTAVFLLKNNET